MTGIIKKLLAPISDDDDYMIGQWPGEPPRKYDVLRMEAADEIERLRAALRDMEQEVATHHAENVSRAELGGSDMAKRKAKAIVSRSGVLFYKIKYIAHAVLEGK